MLIDLGRNDVGRVSEIGSVVATTEPISETRPTSFLPRSMSIKCSAISFGSLSRSSSLN